jgi:ABC-type glycerol-3-phosphate transport system permease component
MTEATATATAAPATDVRRAGSWVFYTGVAVLVVWVLVPIYLLFVNALSSPEEVTGFPKNCARPQQQARVNHHFSVGMNQLQSLTNKRYKQIIRNAVAIFTAQQQTTKRHQKHQPYKSDHDPEKLQACKGCLDLIWFVCPHSNFPGFAH